MVSGISGTNSWYYLSQLLQQSGSSSSSSTSSSKNLFSSIDTNGDGTINSSELETFLSTLGGTSSSSNGVTQSQLDSLSLLSLFQDAQQLDSATGTTTSADQLFNKIADGDGSISKSEFETFVSNLEGQSGSSASSSGTSAADRLFSAIDTNGDGSISKSEFETFVSSMQASAPPPPPPDSSSSLENLFQALEGTGTDSTATGATSSAAASSTSSQQSGTDNFLTAIMEAIGKYMMYAQGAQALTSTGLLSVTG